jgi:hypothetical protein
MTTAGHLILLAQFPILAQVIIDVLVNGFERSAEPEPTPEQPARQPELGIELALSIYQYRMEHDEIR